MTPSLENIDKLCISPWGFKSETVVYNFITQAGSLFVPFNGSVDHETYRLHHEILQYITNMSFDPT